VGHCISYTHLKNSSEQAMDLHLEKKDPPPPNRRTVTTTEEGHDAIVQAVLKQTRCHPGNGVDQKATAGA